MSDVADEIFRKEMENMIGKADIDESIDLEDDEKNEIQSEEVSLSENADMVEGFGDDEENGELNEGDGENDFFDGESDLEVFKEQQNIDDEGNEVMEVDEEQEEKPKGKKNKKKASKSDSPIASAEDFEHLIDQNEQAPTSHLKKRQIKNFK